MFRSARIKLTAFYLIVLATICVIFSIVVYRIAIEEVKRGLHLQTLRMIAKPFSRGYISTKEGPQSIAIVSLDKTLEDTEERIFSEIRTRILLVLIAIDLGIIALAGLASYFLAGKTLAPIETMVDDQKRFIADASHELRTPLTSLKTEIEVGLRDKHLTLAGSKKLLVSNLEEVEKLRKLSEYLLQFEQHQNSTMQSREPVDLRAVLSDVHKKMESLADQKQITIQFEQASLDPVLTVGIKESLQELFTILIDNAIKYSPKDTTITLSLHHTAKHVHIRIQDQGIGIKASELPYIYNRFYRADSSRSKQQIDGYGLGLSIAHNIVTQHRGTIHVESQPHKGTTFTVNLPHI